MTIYAATSNRTDSRIVHAASDPGTGLGTLRSLCGHSVWREADKEINCPACLRQLDRMEPA